MATFNTLLKYVILFAALAVPGYVLGKIKHLEERAIVSMTNILTDIAMPFLVFTKLLGVDVGGIRAADIIMCILLPIALDIILFIAVKGFFGKKGELSKTRAEHFCSVFSNCGFMGIPLVCAIFPDSPDIAFYISLYNIVNTYLLLTLGVYILSGEKKSVSVKKLAFSPVLIAIIAGLSVSLLFGETELAGFIESYSSMLANVSAPLSMIILGFDLSKIGFSRIFNQLSVYKTSLMKLIVSPLIMVVMLVVLRSVFRVEIGMELVSALFIGSAISSAASSPAMSQKYGADPELAAALTLGTTLMCVVTLPLLYLPVTLIFA